MKVKIVKCKWPDSTWYANIIGEIFECEFQTEFDQDEIDFCKRRGEELTSDTYDLVPTQENITKMKSLEKQGKLKKINWDEEFHSVIPVIMNEDGEVIGDTEQ